MDHSQIKNILLAIDIGKESYCSLFSKRGAKCINGSVALYFLNLNGQPRTIEVINKEFSKNIVSKVKVRRNKFKSYRIPSARTGCKSIR